MSSVPVITTINFAFSILISTYLSIMNTKNLTAKKYKQTVSSIAGIVSSAVLNNETSKGKDKFIQLCFEEWISTKSQKLITDKQFPLQLCSDAWDETFTVQFVNTLKRFSNSVFAFFGISNTANSKKILENIYNQTLNNPIEYYNQSQLDSNQVQQESNNFFNTNLNLTNAIISETTLLSLVLVSILLIILPYIINEKDTITKWLLTQSNVLKTYIKDFNAVLTNYFKVKQEKAILKTINREIKLSKRKSRKNRSLLKKGGIRSLKN